MKKNSLAFAAAALVGATIATGAVAHHSFSMFNPDIELVKTGKVAKWAFNSPHTFKMIEDAEGTIWAFEGAAPPSLLARSPQMTGETFKVGDDITVIVCPLRDGRNGGAAGLYITADGTVYNPSDAGCHANQRTAEWPEWVAKGYMSKEEAEAAQ